MTPEQARTVLKHAEEFPARAKRYEAEGGLRRAFACKACGWISIAESEEQAKRQLGTVDRCRANGCAHDGIKPTGRFFPPDDFF